MSTFEGVNLKDIRKSVQIQVKDKGIVTKYYSRWITDIYSQYQRVGADEIRKDIGLKFAIYQGGLINNSRHFCEERNGNVYHIDEILAWSKLDWKGKQEVGYNPVFDCGGYNCRHRLDWVSDQLAFRMRPELEEMYGGN
jgi:hypothetical protein